VVGAFTVNLADVGSYVFTVANAAATAITFAGDGLTGVNALLVDASAFTHTLTLTSGDGDDQITVGSGTTNLTLGDGNNTVTVADSALNNALSITGGTGTDVLLISDSAAISNSDLNNISGIDTIRLGANSASMIIVNTYVNATDDGDTLIIDNQGFTLSSLRTSQLSGGNGVTITGTGQVTLSNHDNNTITIADGVNGDIMGGTQRDIIYGGTGNDVVNSRNDHDSVLGGDGDDDLFGDRNNDTLDGGSGNDTLNGGREHDILLLETVLML
ncbi:MAG: calcium-binding protein, partial [Rickettsiales bacterium]